MKANKSLWNILIYCAVFALVACLLFPNFFKRLENTLYDFHMASSGHIANEDIILVSIDDYTVDKIDGNPTRDIIARTLELIIEAAPRSITLTQPMPQLEADMGEQYLKSLQDQILNTKQKLKVSDSSEEKSTLDAFLAELEEALLAIKTDERLAEVINTYPRIVMPIVLNQSSQPDNSSDLSERKDKNIALLNNSGELFPDTTDYFKLSPPNEMLTKVSDFFGIRNTTLETDNIVRQERFIWGHSQKIFPSLSLMTALLATSSDPNQLPSELAISLNDNNSLKIANLKTELPKNGYIFTRFYSGTLTDNFEEYSFYDVFAESVPTQVFADKIVLLGNNALNNSTKSTYANDQQMTGFEAAAHTVSSLLNNDWIKRNNDQRIIEAFIYLSIFAYLVFIAPRISILAGSVVTALSVLLLFVLEFGALEQSYWLKLFSPAIFLVLGHLMHSFVFMRSQENLNAKAKREQNATNFQLGLALQKQGATDMALEKFLACAPARHLLNPLYNLGLEYERKRQYSKAYAVYEHMEGIDKDYLDINNRKQQVNNATQTISNQQILEASNSLGSSLILSSSSVENPQLGRYIIERELGRGAMSVVYLGRDPSIDRTVAIKVQHFTGDDMDNVNIMRERFLSEARTAGKLNHPDIITIYDVGEESDLAYIAMEYLKGEPLDMFVNDIRLNDEKLLSLAIRVARALGYAHKHKVIHRDIKPSNILYDDRNNEVHITDFGIAHIQDAGLTQTGTVVGTPSYMSPEQITGKSVSPQSDLFSLGVTLYQLLTGRLPFEADTLASLLYKITSESPIPIEVLRPDLKADIGKIISRLLKKEPGERYKDAEELANELEHCKNTLKNSV